MRGWLAEIRRQHDLERQIEPYAQLQRQVEVFSEWIILPWDAEAAASFTRFRREGVRVGSLDLKIACVALAHDVTLLTRNTSDFSQVPGLRFENWLQ
jgi:tRNA(fMet)-specific endonuclease VapC